MSNENLTEKTLADVQAGIPARDAEIAALRKENTELREQLEAVGAGGVNGRLMPGAAPVIGADQFRDAAQMIEPCGNSGELDERKVFESWVEKREGFPYARQFMNLMWESWQARAALAQQDADKMDAELFYKLGCFIDYATGGRLSKLNWPLATLKQSHDENLEALIAERIQEANEDEQDADKEDAERYRWLRDGNAYFPEEEMIRGGNQLDSAIDAARKE